MVRYNPKIEEGLSSKEVNERIKSGNVNYNTNVKTKTIGQIIFYNYLCRKFDIFIEGTNKNQ